MRLRFAAVLLAGSLATGALGVVAANAVTASRGGRDIETLALPVGGPGGQFGHMGDPPVPLQGANVTTSALKGRSLLIARFDGWGYCNSAEPGSISITVDGVQAAPIYNGTNTPPLGDGNGSSFIVERSTVVGAGSHDVQVMIQGLAQVDDNNPTSCSFAGTHLTVTVAAL